MTWRGIVNRLFSPQEFERYVEGLQFTKWRASFCVIHNTGSPTLLQWMSSPEQQRILNLENYYKNQMHWSAGPHLFISPSGIWAFSPLTSPGVHSPSWNSISI